MLLVSFSSCREFLVLWLLNAPLLVHVYRHHYRAELWGIKDQVRQIWERIPSEICSPRRWVRWCSWVWWRSCPERPGCLWTQCAASWCSPGCTPPALAWTHDARRTAAGSRWQSLCTAARSCRNEDEKWRKSWQCWQNSSVKLNM